MKLIFKEAAVIEKKNTAWSDRIFFDRGSYADCPQESHGLLNYPHAAIFIQFLPVGKPGSMFFCFDGLDVHQKPCNINAAKKRQDRTAECFFQCIYRLPAFYFPDSKKRMFPVSYRNSCPITWHSALLFFLKTVLDTAR